MSTRKEAITGVGIVIGVFGLTIMCLEINSKNENKHGGTIPTKVRQAQEDIVGTWQPMNDNPKPGEKVIFTADGYLKIYPEGMANVVKYDISSPGTLTFTNTRRDSTFSSGYSFTDEGLLFLDKGPNGPAMLRRVTL
jgi:hypothetical protein